MPNTSEEIPIKTLENQIELVGRHARITKLKLKLDKGCKTFICVKSKALNRHICSWNEKSYVRSNQSKTKSTYLDLIRPARNWCWTCLRLAMQEFVFEQFALAPWRSRNAVVHCSSNRTPVCITVIASETSCWVVDISMSICKPVMASSQV